MTSTYERGNHHLPRHLNPGRGEPMRSDNPTAKILIAKGLSIMELSRRVSISRVMISEYMRGKRPWPRTALRKVSVELGVPPKMLTGEMPLPRAITALFEDVD